MYIWVGKFYWWRILLDTLELGNAVIDDLNDADQKLGKKTGMSVARIGSRWAGAAIGAKAGAMTGSMDRLFRTWTNRQ